MRVEILPGSLPGYESAYWVEDDVLVIELGRALDEVAQQRIIREAKLAHGVTGRGGRRFLPVPIVGAAERLRDTARNRPGPTTAVTVAALAALAAAPLLTQHGDGADQARPPAVSQPQPTRSPGTPASGASGTPGPARPGPAPTGRVPGDSPGGNVPAPRPAPERTTGLPNPPKATRPPSAPTEKPPSPAPASCAIGVTLEPVAQVRLLCED